MANKDLRDWIAAVQASRCSKGTPPNYMVACRLAPELQCAAMLAVLSAEGIAADRVTFLDQLGRSAHFAAYHDIDIAPTRFRTAAA